MLVFVESPSHLSVRSGLKTEEELSLLWLEVYYSMAFKLNAWYILNETAETKTYIIRSGQLCGLVIKIVIWEAPQIEN